jgi:hypothetical protein
MVHRQHEGRDMSVVTGKIMQQMHQRQGIAAAGHGHGPRRG